MLLQIVKEKTIENIPYLKNNKKIGILRTNKSIFKSEIIEQYKIDQFIDEQDIKFIGILCTNFNIVNPNDYNHVIDKLEKTEQDIMVEYERYKEIDDNPLVLSDNESVMVVMRPNGKTKNGKEGWEIKGLLAYNKITFEKTSIVDPNDIRKVIGRVNSEIDIFVEKNKLLKISDLQRTLSTRISRRQTKDKARKKRCR